jgi:hypothetical protein
MPSEKNKTKPLKEETKTEKVYTVPSLDQPPSWMEIALALSRAEGQNKISKQRALQIHDRAMQKLHERLKEDPLIQEWLKGTKEVLMPRKTYGQV